MRTAGFPVGVTEVLKNRLYGVITKIDKDDSNPKQARSYLELAGCTTIFEVEFLYRRRCGGFVSGIPRYGE